jgi:hypothetical protein
VSFTTVPGNRVYERYEIIGPFFIGLHWSPELLEENGKPKAGVEIHILAMISEARTRRHGIGDVHLQTQKKRWNRLEPADVEGRSGPSRGYYLIPPDLVRRDVDLRGEFEGEIYLNPQEIVVPVVPGRSTQFKHFGGMDVRITKVDQDRGKIEFILSWDFGLKGDDANRLQEILQRQKNLSAEEEQKFRRWLDARSEKIRLLHIADHQLLDKENKLIPWSQSLTHEFENLRVQIEFKKGQTPKQLRLSLGEKKLVTGVFKFKNALSKKR